jgi:hypothetical protein
VSLDEEVNNVGIELQIASSCIELLNAHGHESRVEVDAVAHGVGHRACVGERVAVTAVGHERRTRIGCHLASHGRIHK